MCLTPKKKKKQVSKHQIPTLAVDPDPAWMLLSWLRHRKHKYVKLVLPGPGRNSTPRVRRMLSPRLMP